MAKRDESLGILGGKHQGQRKGTASLLPPSTASNYPRRIWKRMSLTDSPGKKIKPSRVKQTGHQPAGHQVAGTQGLLPRNFPVAFAVWFTLGSSESGRVVGLGVL